VSQKTFKAQLAIIINIEAKKIAKIKKETLDQARLRPQPAGRRVLNGKVINTLIKLKSSGLTDPTASIRGASLGTIQFSCKKWW